MVGCPITVELSPARSSFSGSPQEVFPERLTLKMVQPFFFLGSFQQRVKYIVLNPLLNLATPSFALVLSVSGASAGMGVFQSPLRSLRARKRSENRLPVQLSRSFPVAASRSEVKMIELCVLSAYAGA